MTEIEKIKIEIYDLQIKSMKLNNENKSINEQITLKVTQINRLEKYESTQNDKSANRDKDS